MSEPPRSALRLEGLARTYASPAGPVEVFDDVSVEILAGEVAVLVGPSGSGKSSLLHAAGLLEAPTRGRIHIGEVDTTGLSDAARTELRREEIGFVYQFHHLITEYSAQENVALPLEIAGASPRAAADQAAELLTAVGLAPRLRHRPPELSGGEQQRVAIARALANTPALLLADEPTGSLDVRTGEEVFELIFRLARERGLAVLLATHNVGLAQRGDRILRLEGGRLS